MAALMQQLAETNERFDALKAQVERMTENAADDRLARLERIASIHGAILGEFETNAVKSDIFALVQESKALLAAVRPENVPQEPSNAVA